MKYKLCKICGELGWEGEHKCNPIYTVYDEDYAGDEGIEVHAYNFENAAEKYAIDRNDDHYLMDNAITIRIVSPDGVEKEAEIWAEPSIEYHCKIIN